MFKLNEWINQNIFDFQTFTHFNQKYVKSDIMLTE